jgi:NADH dehydrogenase
MSKNIVILGGGYGGIAVTKQLLQGQIPEDNRIILVDRMPFQGLKTEYYALASGTIADADLRVPFPSDPRLSIYYEEIISLDIHKRLIYFRDNEPLDFDQLIISLGCTDRYHGVPGAELYANSLQSFASTRITYQNINNLSPYRQVSIVGGGLSGVELAAELRESRPDLNIRIIDRGASILSTFPNKLIDYVQQWFYEHEVEMLSHISLTRVEPGLLSMSEQSIHTDATVWTAGIQPSRIVQHLDVDKDTQGRVLLNEWHQIPGSPHVYVVGDCASLPYAPSGQAAEAQGLQVAEVIRASWLGKQPKLGKIKLKGMLGSLGKKTGFGVDVIGKNTVLVGRVPRVIKSGVLWMAKHHLG